MNKQSKYAPIKKTDKDIAIYSMCSSCYHDYGDVQGFRHKPGMTYRACRYYLDTNKHRGDSITYKNGQCSCTHYIAKEGQRKRADNYGLKPLTLKRGISTAEHTKGKGMYDEV